VGVGVYGYETWAVVGGIACMLALFGTTFGGRVSSLEVVDATTGASVSRVQGAPRTLLSYALWLVAGVAGWVYPWGGTTFLLFCIIPIISYLGAPRVIE
jgi:hypothetical protein